MFTIHTHAVATMQATPDAVAFETALDPAELAAEVAGMTAAFGEPETFVSATGSLREWIWSDAGKTGQSFTFRTWQCSCRMG